MRSNRFHKVAVFTAMLATGLSGCGGGGPGGEKSGGPAEPQSLRLGAVEGPEAPYADEVKEFASAVSKLSNGSIKIDIVWNAAAPTAGESETKLAHIVTDGKIDLAVVPTRVWDQLEVTSMQALQAPFLVDNLGLLNAIATSDLAGGMLSGLDAVGVKGMAIWPDSLRHPIGLTKPLLTVADFKGARLRVPPSEASYSLAAALGARTVDPKDWVTDASAGKLDGAESAFVWANDLGIAGTLTANITFFPKANAIVANDRIFEALSSDQQKILQQAATETTAYVVKTNTSEHDLAPEYCKVGGSVTLASDSDIVDLQKQAAPALAELEKNPGTKRLIDGITALKAKTPADPAAAAVACKPTATSAPVATSADEPTAFPEGVYRANSPQYGIISMVYKDGVWQHIESDGKIDCTATFVVKSGRLWLTSSTDPAMSCGNPPGKIFLDAAWTLEGDQLRFVDINSDLNAIQEFSLPWTKIG